MHGMMNGEGVRREVMIGVYHWRSGASLRLNR